MTNFMRSEDPLARPLLLPSRREYLAIASLENFSSPPESFMVQLVDLGPCKIFLLHDSAGLVPTLDSTPHDSRRGP